ncbi:MULTISPECIES: transglycosylase domain-containing protein [Actinomadura]|uniref:transglycosylase domain-containing protein n=1 Tax=Actinomadura TaxID=1988 RepID=UPI000478FF77|nr:MULTISPECIES: transglycosylase domain-containing protein [Actinomadura]RSN54685.1 penicillin-binding protein [Actinomadura sp. WAC 06369]
MGIVAIATLLVVVYVQTPIPDEAQADAVRQSSVIEYKDGEVLARVGMNRTSVPLDQVPKHVQNAVLAAEDRKFWTEPGVSPSGIARAVVTAATGGEVTGASTITQQLARNYFAGLSQERTVSRKLKEIMISIRLGNEEKKEKILELYLNTVPFGRQAYGIQAAARAYFHTTVDKLTVEQAALLAAMIQQPSYFVTYGNPTDPEKKKAKEALVFRWNYVLKGMVEEGWLEESKRQAMKFPQTQKEWSDVQGGEQAGYLRERVVRELEALGIPETALETEGLKITTTFDHGLQEFTAKAVEKIKKDNGLGKEIHFGLSAVDPKTGGVIAAYGGPGYEEQQFDDSFQGKVQPGSSFKPIVLATALSQGISLKTTMDGSYRRVINGTPFTNDNRAEDGVYDLQEMTAMSINTSYVELGQKVGLENVIQMAKKMGMKDAPLEPVTSLPLGVIDASSVTMASVYSTFAAGGVHRPAHVIKSIEKINGDPVKNEDGEVVKKNPWGDGERVFEEGVARDATAAMRDVVTSGTGERAALPDRPVAGKTGTTDKHRSAWFVGYTPQLSTAVAMWREDKNRNRLSLEGIGNYTQVYGGTVPADLFKTFMMQAHKGQPVMQFEPAVYGGEVAAWAKPELTTPSPSSSPSTSTSPSCRPGQDGPGGQDGENCQSESPPATESPTGQPTGGAKKPCTSPWNTPVGCDPALPPPGYPDWWCDRENRRETVPECRPENPEGPGGPNGPNTQND